MRLGVYNLVDRAEQISADSENSFFPASNLVELPTYKEYRSATGSEPKAKIFLAFDAMSRVDSLFLCGNKVTGELNLTKIIVKGNGTPNSWDLDEANFPGYWQEFELDVEHHRHNLVYLPIDTGDQNYQYWCLEIENAGGDFVGFSNFFIGESMVAQALDIDNGWTYGLESFSDVKKGDYGQQFIDKGGTQKVFNFAFSLLNTDEFKEINEALEFCATHTPLWLVVDEANTDLSTDVEQFAGYFLVSEVSEAEVPFHGIYNLALSIEEVI